MASFKVGDRVVQSNYGAGTITGADDHHTVIDFDEHGVKTFATGLVVLERTAAPAPQKGAKTRRTAKAGPGTAKASPSAAKASAAAPKASAAAPKASASAPKAGASASKAGASASKASASASKASAKA